MNTAVYLRLLQRARENAHSRDTILTRFEGTDTAVYGQSMSKWVPDHDEVWALMVEAIRPFVNTDSQLLDVGAGTGRFAKMVLSAFDGLHILLTDFSANMLAGATEKLADFEGRFGTQTADFFSDEFVFEDGRFDCIYSTFAIHHGREVAQYAALYRKIHRWLKPGGCFICCDHILGATDYLTALNMAQWDKMMQPYLDQKTRDWTIESTYEEDSPLTMVQHLELLEKAGFTAVDVLWKKQIFGLYMGIKEK